MVAPERILVIGDTDHQVGAAVSQAVPAAQVSVAEDWFDGIAQACAGGFASVLASVQPVEHRAASAVNILRQAAGAARLLLFGPPALEPLSRRMLECGCDDYLIIPTSPGELHQVLGAPLMRIAPSPTIENESAVEADPQPLLMGLPVADLLLESLAEHPADAMAHAIRKLNEHLSPTMQLVYAPPNAAAPAAQDGRVVVSHAVRHDEQEIGHLQLLLPRNEDPNVARHLVARLSSVLGRVQALVDRHNRLQKLAITDDLTGVSNARYFRHFLARIIELARAKRFPVTLFMFDIDNFKRYNDEYGHPVGDEILKQTAALMRRCCREHDLVARIGGDEFAAVFWEKEGPRQPKDPKIKPPGRTPQTPLDILGRFRKALANQEFKGLGPGGKGTLTISGSLAVYPYDGRTMEELIEAADHELMFRAKQSGKNKIFLVGSQEQFA